MTKAIEILNQDTQEITLTPDIFERFIKYVDVKPASLKTYKKAIKNYYSFLNERGLVDNQTRQTVLAYRDYLRENYSSSTVNLYISAVRQFYSWLNVETNGAVADLAKGIKGAKTTRGFKKDYLTSSQVVSVMSVIDTDSLQGLRDFALMYLLFTGGLRTIEVVRANIEDLQTQGGKSMLYVQGKGKDDKGDYIVIVPECENAIRAYLTSREEKDLTAPLFASCSNNSNGNRLTTRSISRIVKDYLKEVGLNSDRLTAHSTRHTAATLALLGGSSLQEVQQFLRHSSITTTQIYSHNLNALNNTAALNIAAQIG